MAVFLCLLACGLQRMIGRVASVCCDSLHARFWVVAAGGEHVRYRLAWPAMLVRKDGMQQIIELWLSASEFLDRIASLIRPPRKHRHRYFGVLAPNSPWRAQVAAQAGRKLGAGSNAPRPKTVRAVSGCGLARHPARCLWAQLLGRIYGV